ncbi:formate--tetrahydrofolate ligase, partial [Methylophilaceae bacterium]|nr:formate--tetrahydrofolate ligase [Methylophilaceae bacterium]
FMYKDNDSIQEKINTLAKNIYHAKEVIYEDLAQEQLKDLGTKYMKFPVCIAKTPYSFSSDPALKGAASDHSLIVKEIKLARGAEFLVIICGSVMTMPGLPMKPASENMSVDKEGKIEGLS